MTTTSAQTVTLPTPYTYGYLYPDGVVRFTGGGLWNGANPVKEVPLWDEKDIARLTSSLAAAEARVGEMLAIVKSAYYSEPTGTAENAWNAALEHIEEGFDAALSQTEEGR